MNFISKKMLQIVENKMGLINQIALEDEDYNTLYLELRNLDNCLRRVIKADYAISEKKKKREFLKDIKQETLEEISRCRL